MLLSISNFWSMFLFIHLRNLFIQELNIPDHKIDSSIFGLLSRNVDSTHGIFEKLLLLWWIRPSMVFIIFSITLLGWSHPLMNIIPWAYPFVDLYSLDHPLGWTCPLVDLYFLNHPLGWYRPLVDLIFFGSSFRMNPSTCGPYNFQFTPLDEPVHLWTHYFWISSWDELVHKASYSYKKLVVDMVF